MYCRWHKPYCHCCMQQDTPHANFYSGTSNIVLPVANKGYFPPEYQEKSRLCYYASLFNSLEVNSSFYKIPMPRTVERWATEVPDDFRFTFKLWKAITHSKELDYDPESITKFMRAIDTAGSKKGALLIQFPGSIKVSMLQKFRQLMDDLQATNLTSGWRLAIEFRDKSWYRDNVYQLLEQYKAGVVVHDMPASSTPLIDMETDFMFLRFHGENGDYRGSYEDDHLHEQAQYIKDWLAEGKTVFSYFNNTMGAAVHNLMTLNAYVREENTFD